MREPDCYFDDCLVEHAWEDPCISTTPEPEKPRAKNVIKVKGLRFTRLDAEGNPVGDMVTSASGWRAPLEVSYDLNLLTGSVRDLMPEFRAMRRSVTYASDRMDAMTFALMYGSTEPTDPDKTSE